MGGELTPEQLRVRAEAHAEAQARLRRLEADPEYLNRAAAIHEMIMDGMVVGKDDQGNRFAVSTQAVELDDLDVTRKAIEITKLRVEDEGGVCVGGILTSRDEDGKAQFEYQVIVGSQSSDPEQTETTDTDK